MQSWTGSTTLDATHGGSILVRVRSSISHTLNVATRNPDLDMTYTMSDGQFSTQISYGEPSLQSWSAVFDGSDGYSYWCDVVPTGVQSTLIVVATASEGADIVEAYVSAREA